jgi:hypothetical protein
VYAGLGLKASLSSMKKLFQLKYFFYFLRQGYEENKSAKFKAVFNKRHYTAVSFPARPAAFIIFIFSSKLECRL